MPKFIAGRVYKINNVDESYGMMLATEVRNGTNYGLFQRFGHAVMRVAENDDNAAVLELVGDTPKKSTTKKSTTKSTSKK